MLTLKAFGGAIKPHTLKVIRRELQPKCKCFGNITEQSEEQYGKLNKICTREDCVLYSPRQSARANFGNVAVTTETDGTLSMMGSLVGAEPTLRIISTDVEGEDGRQPCVINIILEPQTHKNDLFLAFLQDALHSGDLSESMTRRIEEFSDEHPGVFEWALDNTRRNVGERKMLDDGYGYEQTNAALCCMRDVPARPYTTYPDSIYCTRDQEPLPMYQLDNDNNNNTTNRYEDIDNGNYGCPPTRKHSKYLTVDPVRAVCDLTSDEVDLVMNRRRWLYSAAPEDHTGHRSDQKKPHNDDTRQYQPSSEEIKVEVERDVVSKGTYNRFNYRGPCGRRDEKRTYSTFYSTKNEDGDNRLYGGSKERKTEGRDGEVKASNGGEAEEMEQKILVSVRKVLNSTAVVGDEAPNTGVDKTVAALGGGTQSPESSPKKGEETTLGEQQRTASHPAVVDLSNAADLPVILMEPDAKMQAGHLLCYAKLVRKFKRWQRPFESRKNQQDEVKVGEATITVGQNPPPTDREILRAVRATKESRPRPQRVVDVAKVIPNKLRKPLLTADNHPPIKEESDLKRARDLKITSDTVKVGDVDVRLVEEARPPYKMAFKEDSLDDRKKFDEPEDNYKEYRDWQRETKIGKAVRQAEEKIKEDVKDVLKAIDEVRDVKAKHRQMEALARECKTQDAIDKEKVKRIALSKSPKQPPRLSPDVKQGRNDIRVKAENKNDEKAKLETKKKAKPMGPVKMNPVANVHADTHEMARQIRHEVIPAQMMKPLAKVPMPVVNKEPIKPEEDIIPEADDPLAQGEHCTVATEKTKPTNDFMIKMCEGRPLEYIPQFVPNQPNAAASATNTHQVMQSSEQEVKKVSPEAVQPVQEVGQKTQQSKVIYCIETIEVAPVLTERQDCPQSLPHRPEDNIERYVDAKESANQHRMESAERSAGETVRFYVDEGFRNMIEQHSVKDRAMKKDEEEMAKRLSDFDPAVRVTEEPQINVGDVDIPGIHVPLEPFVLTAISKPPDPTDPNDLKTYEPKDPRGMVHVPVDPKFPEAAKEADSEVECPKKPAEDHCETIYKMVSSETPKQPGKSKDSGQLKERDCKKKEKKSKCTILPGGACGEDNEKGKRAFHVDSSSRALMAKETPKEPGKSKNSGQPQERECPKKEKKSKCTILPGGSCGDDANKGKKAAHPDHLHNMMPVDVGCQRQQSLVEVVAKMAAREPPHDEKKKGPRDGTHGGPLRTTTTEYSLIERLLEQGALAKERKAAVKSEAATENDIWRKMGNLLHGRGMQCAGSGSGAGGSGGSSGNDGSGKRKGVVCERKKEEDQADDPCAEYGKGDKKEGQEVKRDPCKSKADAGRKDEKKAYAGKMDDKPKSANRCGMVVRPCGKNINTGGAKKSDSASNDNLAKKAEDPSSKTDLNKKDPCSNTSMAKKADLYTKKDATVAKQQNLCKKSEDPCAKIEAVAAKKAADPSSRTDIKKDPCSNTSMAKKADLCPKKDATVAKQQNLCKKSEDPCAKIEAASAKKAQDPSSRTDIKKDPCSNISMAKKADPCAKEGATAAKQQIVCKKSEDPCAKIEAAAAKKAEDSSSKTDLQKDPCSNTSMTKKADPCAKKDATAARQQIVCKKSEDPCAKIEAAAAKKAQNPSSKTDLKKDPCSNTSMAKKADPCAKKNATAAKQQIVCKKSEDPCAKIEAAAAKKAQDPSSKTDLKKDPCSNTSMAKKADPCAKKCATAARQQIVCKKSEDPCAKIEAAAAKKAQNPSSKTDLKKHPCSNTSMAKKADPCAKKDATAARQQIVCKKSEDPCAKIEAAAAKKAQNPSSKTDLKKDPCSNTSMAKKADPCAKKDATAAKQQIVCKKSEDPCAKIEAAAAKKSQNPSSKTDLKKDPCSNTSMAQKVDPCPKKGATAAKQQIVCKKSEDPCAKKGATEENKASTCAAAKKSDVCSKSNLAKKAATEPCAKKQQDPCVKGKTVVTQQPISCRKSEDPCAKKDKAADQDAKNPSEKKDVAQKRQDPCAKELAMKAEDPCAKKSADRIAAMNFHSGANGGNPCGKGDGGRNSKDIAKEFIDPCGKKNDASKVAAAEPQKKTEDPCKKKDAPSSVAKAKSDPCLKRDNPAKKDGAVPKKCASSSSVAKKAGAAMKDPCAKKDEKKADPCAKKDEKKPDPSAKTDEKKANPCAKKCEKKPNPCAKKDEKKADPRAKKNEKKPDPCAKKDEKKADPCAKKDEKKADPCAKKDEKKPDPCAKKDEKKTDPCAEKDEKKADPCAKKNEKKPDPCAKKDEKKSDPCAKKDEKKTDPCAKKDEKKADPCAKKDEKKTDPCAKKNEKKPDPCSKKDEKKTDQCAKKDEKKTDPCAKKDEKKADPCAKKDEKKADPCAKKDEKKADPCAKKDEKKADPCAKKDEKKADPCAKKDEKKADPCAKKDEKKADPCAKKNEKKADPCAKKDEKKDPCGKKPSGQSLCDPVKKKDLCQQKEAKQDPCKKKDEDPCKKKEKKDNRCGMVVNPCKKAEDPGKKEANPCKKMEDPCKKKDEDPCKKKDEDPCKKKPSGSSLCDPVKKKDLCQQNGEKQDPCKKKDEDPCKKKEDPCKKKDQDPCKKEEDPCKKKEDRCETKEISKKVDPCAKKDEDPCKKEKKEDPCKKDEDPCKKDPCAKDDPCKKKKKKKDPCDPCSSAPSRCKSKEESKKYDPCSKKDKNSCKKKDPCKKAEDPCQKAEDPCDRPEKKEMAPCAMKGNLPDPCENKSDIYAGKCVPKKPKECEKAEDPKPPPPAAALEPPVHPCKAEMKFGPCPMAAKARPDQKDAKPDEAKKLPPPSAKARKSRKFCPPPQTKMSPELLDWRKKLAVKSADGKPDPKDKKRKRKGKGKRQKEEASAEPQKAASSSSFKEIAETGKAACQTLCFVLKEIKSVLTCDDKPGKTKDDRKKLDKSVGEKSGGAKSGGDRKLLPKTDGKSKNDGVRSKCGKKLEKAEKPKEERKLMPKEKVEKPKDGKGKCAKKLDSVDKSKSEQKVAKVEKPADRKDKCGKKLDSVDRSKSEQKVAKVEKPADGKDKCGKKLDASTCVKKSDNVDKGKGDKKKYSTTCCFIKIDAEDVDVICRPRTRKASSCSSLFSSLGKRQAREASHVMFPSSMEDLDVKRRIVEKNMEPLVSS